MRRPSFGSPRTQEVYHDLSMISALTRGIAALFTAFARESARPVTRFYSIDRRQTNSARHLGVRCFVCLSQTCSSAWA